MIARENLSFRLHMKCNSLTFWRDRQDHIAEGTDPIWNMGEFDMLNWKYHRRGPLFFSTVSLPLLVPFSVRRILFKTVENFSDTNGNRYMYTVDV